MAQGRLLAVDRRFQVAQGAEPLDIAFAEQVAAIDDFPDQLFEGNWRPLPAVARPDPLQRRQHPVGRVDLLGNRIAAAAGGRAAIESLALEGGYGDETVTHAGLHRQMRVGGQRAVRVAGDAQHLAALAVDADADAAHRGVAEAGSELTCWAGLISSLPCGLTRNSGAGASPAVLCLGASRPSSLPTMRPAVSE